MALMTYHGEGCGLRRHGSWRCSVTAAVAEC
jgi:hypothetical protein